MAVPSFTGAQAARLRFQSQWLTGSREVSPLDVARHMLALQGQDLPAVQWALGVRAHGSTQDDVRAAFDSGELVRSWPMRGTLHVMASEDLPWLLELAMDRALVGLQRRRDIVGIDETWAERSRDIAVELLRGGRGATRAEFVAALQDAGLDASGQKGYHSIWYLAQTGTLVWGRMRGKEQELHLLDEWITTPRRLERDVALGEAARRYVHARGPVAVRDFAWWTGLRMSDVRRAFEHARDSLREVVVDGTPMWMTATSLDALDPDAPAAQHACLTLPAFDELLLGYQNRDAQLHVGHAGRVCPGGNGVFRPMLVDRGVIVGTWSRTTRARSVVIDTSEFEPLSQRQRTELRTAAAAYAAFVGLELS